MKKISDNIFSGIYLSVMIIALCIFIIAKANIGTLDSLIILLFPAIYVISLIPMHHNFLYDDKFIIVKNSWNPFFEKRYSIKDIKKIKIVIAAYMGKGVKICLHNGSKSTYHISTKRTDLEMMIHDIEKLIKYN